jgi:anti-sigma regulatory factor (Ser/Thr protein kinase)
LSALCAEREQLVNETRPRTTRLRRSLPTPGAIPGAVPHTRLPAGQPRRPRSDYLELGAYPGAVPSARLHTRAILAEWGLTELADSAESVVAELVTNAVEATRREHLEEPVRLTLLAGLRTVLIVMRDPSSSPPVPGSPDGDHESGRGLIIVDALSARWDWKLAPSGGKVVRAIVRGERHA